MKTYTLTPEAQESFDKWLDNKTARTLYEHGIKQCLEAFFQAHPEHLIEAPSTSKRDEVLRVATAAYEGYCSNPNYVKRINSCVDDAVQLIAEVDKRFNTKEG